VSSASEPDLFMPNGSGLKMWVATDWPSLEKPNMRSGVVKRFFLTETGSPSFVNPPMESLEI
jgi:hypothetical protein